MKYEKINLNKFQTVANIYFQESVPFTEIAMEAESLNNSENVENNLQITDEEVTAKDLNSCSNGIKIKQVRNENIEAIELVETPTKSVKRYVHTQREKFRNLLSFFIRKIYI